MRSGPPNVVSSDQIRIATAHQYVWNAHTLAGMGVTSMARMNGFSPSTRIASDTQDRQPAAYRPRGLLPGPVLPRTGESWIWCARVQRTLRAQKRAAYRWLRMTRR